jgi:hypothetical protein
MKDCLVYVKKFKKKLDTAPEFEECRVYKAVDEGEMFNIHLPGGDVLVDKKMQSGEVFDAEIVKITPENHTQFDYEQKDAELVIQSIITPIINQAQKDYTDRQNNLMSDMGSDITDIMLFDTEMAEVISDVIKYVKDASEDRNFFSLDLSPIERHSYAGKGYNIGTAMTHLKSYLDRGKKSDLFKAQLCIFNELIRLDNEKESQA